MSKKWVLLLVLVAYLLSGCTSSSFDVPDNLKDAYVTTAREYLEGKYPDISLTDAFVKVYNTHSSSSKRSVCVTFTVQDYKRSLEVWNIMTYPLDNVAEVLYRDEACEIVYQKAKEVFGYDIIIKPLVGDTIGSRDTKPYRDVNDYLSHRGTFPFILGFIGSETGKRDLIEKFIAELSAEGIAQDFVCCLYADLNTMKKDLKDVESATFMSGDYTNWLSVVENKVSDWLKEE